MTLPIDFLKNESALKFIIFQLMIITLAVSSGTQCVLTMLRSKGEGQRKIIAGGPWSAGS